MSEGMKMPDPKVEAERFLHYPFEGMTREAYVESEVRSLMARTLRAAAARQAGDLGNEGSTHCLSAIHEARQSLERMASEIENGK